MKVDKKIRLSQDNNWSNRKNKRGIEIRLVTLEYELKAFFNWRTPTKRFNTFKDRFYSLGSTKYDNFINHLIDYKGY